MSADTPEPGDLTQLLQQAAAGDRASVDQLLASLYGELHQIASAQLHHERPDHTLQATAIVHEAYLRLARQDRLGATSRAEFFAAAATVMRRVLVDHARSRNRIKRGGDAARTTLDAVADELESRAAPLAELDDVLKELEEIEPRKARLVELRFFAGLGMEEAAEALGVGLRTVERDWTFTRAWMRERLS